MRNKLIRMLGLGLIAVLIVAMTAPVMATSIQDAKNKKASMEKKKQQIEATIKELEAEKGDIKAYIGKLDKELNSLLAQIEELEKELKKTQEQIEITKGELKEAEETEENQYITMKKRIKYIYENGSADYIEVLLAADSMSDLLNRSEYIKKISEYDGLMLERYKETKRTVEEKKAQLEVTLEELNILNEEVELEKAAVTKLIHNKTTELESYEQKIEDSNGLVDEYGKKIKEQDDLIEELIEEELRRAEEAARRAEEAARKAEEERKKNQAANNGGTENTGSVGNVSSSGFMWPSSTSTRITSRFGYRSSPTAGASSYHKGIDIGVASGTNVLASASGTVTVATYQWAAGNYIMISHGDGISTVYMHNSKLLVSVGDYVNKGDVIALAGSTGVSTGPHIHFGVRVNGEYVDPLKYVSP